MSFVPTIGMEIHVELKTKSKMFCSCANETWKINSDRNHDIKTNKNVCPVCLGHPGTLPVPNREAIKMVVRAGLAMNCNIIKKSKFDRKQYFYPDLPKGYQISQFDKPLCFDGFLILGDKKIGITRIHLEEDTGKLSHQEDGSLVDYNRSGVPLMEMVSEPDFGSGKEAKEFCQELQAIFRTLKISDANMEKGQMRCELNISISESEEFGTKVEIKNLNSFKAIERAADFEIERQREVLESGEQVEQETRGWNEDKNETFSQRKKEGSADYRYFPEPDIPPLNLTKEEEIDVMFLKKMIPELPQAKRSRMVAEYGIAMDNAKIIVNDVYLDDYTEDVISELRIWMSDCGKFEGEREVIWQEHGIVVTKLAVNWMINKFNALLVKNNKTWKEAFIVTPENFAEFVVMIYTNQVSKSNALKLLEIMLETGGDPSNILEDENLKVEEVDLGQIIDEIINNNPKQVAEYKAGKETLIKFFVGQVMSQAKGNANPQETETILKEKLS
jgi:aspartyl-tRNA(Asn)/glutamyl-tRNA(Gln) amidotransferase subunit B